MFGLFIADQNNQTLAAARIAAGIAEPPRLSVPEVHWAQDGKFSVRVSSSPLSPGQSIFAFLQVSDSPILYPLVGPCVPSGARGYVCAKGFAADKRLSYKVVVAVLSERDASTVVDHLTYEKVPNTGYYPFPSIDDLPHLDGAATVKSVNAGRRPDA